MEYSPALIQELLIEKLAGTISGKDEQLINELIVSDETIRSQWRAMQQQLEEAREAGFEPDTDAEAAWQKIQPQIASGSVKRLNPYIWLLSSAAAVVALFIGYYIFTNRSTSSSHDNGFFATSSIDSSADIALQLENGQIINLTQPSNEQIALKDGVLTITASNIQASPNNQRGEEWVTLYVPGTKEYTVTLPDGTQVWLNSQTKLRFPGSFTGSEREVYVSGEAFFKVTKNPNQPFIVHTYKPDIKVLGTQFNVNTYDTAAIRTSLVEGSVHTSVNGKGVILKPGFEAVYAASGFTTNTFDSTTTLSWMQGIYYFQDTQLKDLAALLPRWFPVKVAFDNPALASKVFSGALLKHKSLQSFLDNLALSANIHADIKDGVVHFK